MSIVKKPTATTVYHVTVSDNNSTTATDSITIIVNNPQPASTTGGAICGPGTVTLSATRANASDSLNWYTSLVGGTKVGSGNSYTTPSLTATTTYYVEAEQANGSFVMGPASPTAQGGTTGTQTVQWDVYFSLTNPYTLTSVDIFPLNSGEAGEIQVKTSTGTVLATFPFTTNVSGGTTAQTVTLNYTLPAGSYSLYPSIMPTSGLRRNISGAVYPYTSVGGSITGNGYDQTYYMGFFNFVFGTSCKGVRVPVVATINSVPVVSLGNDTSVCSPNTVVLDAQNAGSTYLWSNSSTGQTLTATASGTYSVVVTSANGCTASDAVAVTVNALPVVNLGADTTRCGGSVTLNAGNTGSSYLWTNASTTQTVTASESGTYGVLVTDANGCKASDTVIVTINSIPVVSLGNDTSVCSPNTVVLDAQNAGSTYLWSNSSTGQTLTATASGTYSVVVTSANGCTASDAVAVTVNALPVVSLGADTTRCGGSVTLDAGNTGSSYLWTNASTTQTVTASASGTYGVLVTDANGCKASDTVVVTINSVPVVNLGADTTRCGGSVTLDAGNTGSSYLWSSGATTQTITVTSSAVVNVLVTNVSGCKSSDTVKVTINAIPTVSFNLANDTTCVNGGTITLSGTPTGGTFSGTGVTGTTFNPATAGVGTHTITYLVTDIATSCSASATDVIVVKSACTGIENIAKVATTIYPSPASHVINIKGVVTTRESVQVYLYDAQGRVVMMNTIPTTEVYVLNIADLASGIYTVSVTTENGNYIGRFIRE
jgi:hypothetical protein